MTSNGHARRAARWLLDRGFVPVPVGLGTKKPVGSGWQNRTLDDARDRFDELFPEHLHLNVGALNGAPSGNLADVDCDCPQAVAAGRLLLPATAMRWGRRSAPESHRGYVTEVPVETANVAFDDPAGGRILELRGSGGHTLFVGSVAPGDEDRGTVEEEVVWAAGTGSGEPACIPIVELTRAVRRTAAAALIARHWPVGGRHDCALALAGGLLRAGWQVTEVERFLQAVCAAAQDDEVEDRLRAAADTAECLEAGQPASGWPKLSKLLGNEVVARTIEWLELPPPHRDARRSSEKSEASARPKGNSRSADDSEPQARYIPLPEWVPFPIHCLPAPWDSFVRQGAAALKCDQALIALPVIAALAGAVGNSRRVYLGGEWYEPAVFWTCVVAESGGMKSPAADLSMAMVRARQKRLVAEFKLAVECYRRAAAEYKERARTEDDPGDPPEKPTLKRCLVADVTIEKLAGLLDDNRRGLLVYRDELAGWLGSFCRYAGKSGSSDEPNWLSMYRADALIYDRKTGEKTSVFVPNAATSVCGGIQPGTLVRLMGKQFFDSGLAARINFAMPPRTPKRYSEEEIHPDTKAAAAASLEALFELAPETDADGDPKPIVVKLSRAAKAIWKDHVDRWGVRQFETEGERAAALAKLEAIPARFALLHHLASDPNAVEPISADSLRAGIVVAEWLANETERVYQMLSESEEETELRKLVETVRRLADRHGGRLTVRHLQNSNRRKFRTRQEAEAALESLVEDRLGRWLPVEPTGKGGWTARFFEPLDSIHAPDTSYTCSSQDDDDDGDEEGEPSDTCPGPDPSSPEGPSHPDRVIEDRGGTCGRFAEPGFEQVSEVSGAPRGSETDGVVSAEASATSKRVSDTTEQVSDIPEMKVVATVAALNLLAADVAEHGGPVALDTETTGLDPERDRVRLVQVAVGGVAYVVDLFAFQDPAGALRPLFESLAAVEVVGHNLQFDLQFLARLGFVPGSAFDTMVASQLLHAGDREAATNARLRHGLDDVLERELGIAVDKAQQKSDWSRPTLTAAQLEYAAADVRHLLPLASVLRQKLAAARLADTTACEMKALLGIAWAAPIAVDAAAWTALADSAERDLVRIAEEMDRLAPNPNCLPGTESRNWNSPAEVLAALAQVGVKVNATDDDTLASLTHPLADRLRDYRAAGKRAGTYGKKWLAEHAAGGAVRPHWNQLGAASGRMSCSGPNLQQIPRTGDYRRCFVARPGCVLVKADYSQIELRVAAVVAGEDAMIRAYAEGRDLHPLTASALLGKPIEQVAKGDRQLAKAINFGLLFGMGWKSLGQYAAANYCVTLTDAEAQRYRDAFFRTYPKLLAWHGRVEERLKTHIRRDPEAVLVESTRGGRTCSLPAARWNASGKPFPNKSEFLNFPVQGTAADGMKAAIGLLWERRLDCPGAEPVLFVHDEIVIECPESAAESAKTWLSRCMVDGMAPLVAPVPVEVEATAGTTWGG